MIPDPVGIHSWQILIVGPPGDIELRLALTERLGENDLEGITIWGADSLDKAIALLEGHRAPLHAIVLWDDMAWPICSLIRKYRPEAVPVHLVNNRVLPNTEFDLHRLTTHSRRGHQRSLDISTDEVDWRERLAMELQIWLLSEYVDQQLQWNGQANRYHLLGLDPIREACLIRINMYWHRLDEEAKERVCEYCKVTETDSDVQITWL